MGKSQKTRTHDNPSLDRDRSKPGVKRFRRYHAGGRHRSPRAHLGPKLDGQFKLRDFEHDISRTYAVYLKAAGLSRHPILVFERAQADRALARAKTETWLGVEVRAFQAPAIRSPEMA
ncbi:MAG: hypothetical protein ACREDR_24015 [Blastocatellia bacterium]